MKSLSINQNANHECMPPSNATGNNLLKIFVFPLNFLSFLNDLYTRKTVLSYSIKKDFCSAFMSVQSDQKLCCLY